METTRVCLYSFTMMKLTPLYLEVSKESVNKVLHITNKAG